MYVINNYNVWHSNGGCMGFFNKFVLLSTLLCVTKFNSVSIPDGDNIACFEASNAIQMTQSLVQDKKEIGRAHV